MKTYSVIIVFILTCLLFGCSDFNNNYLNATYKTEIIKGTVTEIEKKCMSVKPIIFSNFIEVKVEGDTFVQNIGYNSYFKGDVVNVKKCCTYSGEGKLIRVDYYIEN